jgi:acetoacetyl-CoA synthetase
MDTILWQPSQKAIAKSNMTRFMQFVNQVYHLNISYYDEFYQWSIHEKEKFWQAVCEFCGIKCAKFADKILVNAELLPKAKWFVGAELNFAENLLKRKDSKTALIYHGENNNRRTLSYADLYRATSKIAKYLQQLNIKPLDRVAAIMPNIPETIIAMLATTSLGAIWTSCSPDFGRDGLLERFSQIEPKILFVANGYLYNGKIYDILPKIKTVLSHLPTIQKIILTPHIQTIPYLSEMPEVELFDTVLSTTHETKINFKQLPFDHPVYIMYSSGTTDIPKCIVHGAGGTLLQHLKELILHTDLTENDTIFYYTTCGWMMWNWYISSLATGATLVQYDGAALYPTPGRLFNLIDEEKISIFGTSAKYISTLEKYGLQPKHTHQLNSLKTILSTGSPLVAKNFDYVYQQIKSDVRLSSISGGTDIISCFALGNPILPVYQGEIQCRGMGMQVEIFNEKGESIIAEKGELVCTAPFPSMPVYFWADPDGSKYYKSYFSKYPNVWNHGDYAEITGHNGLIIYGRSDTTLNPGGIRIGTAEIYRQIEKISKILDSVAVEQQWENDTRIILFVKLSENKQLTTELEDEIKTLIRNNCSPHHVPAKIIQVADIPKTLNGKTMELAVRNIIHGRAIKNINAVANPESLEYFKNLFELQS